MKIVREKIIEGVADKYVQQDPYLHAVPDEFGDFEKSYSEEQEKKTGKIFFKNNELTLIKNPQSLRNFQPGVRGVILESGDLYVELTDAVVHIQIIEILKNKKIVPETVDKKWTQKLPSENKFVTVIRIGNSDTMCIGPSNRAIYDKDNYNKYIYQYEEYFRRAKEKCKGIGFSNKILHKIFGAEAKEDHFLK